MYEDETHPAATPESRRAHSRGGVLTGEDLGRIISLSDGVFAFSLTLLVISLVVPVYTGSATRINSDLSSYLRSHWTVFLGYAFAFVMIAVWWTVHTRTFQYLARFDRAVIWINFALLFQIAIMPFVLAVFDDYSDTQTAVVLFAGIQMTLGLTNTLLWDYARRAKLVKDSLGPELAIYYSRRGYLTALVFAVSIGISFVSLSAAEIFWIATFLVQWYADRRAR